MKTPAIIICLIAVMFTGCKTNSIPGLIKLDTGYRFYTREVFRDEKSGEKSIQTNIVKSRDADSTADRFDLLEVQLLMVNRSNCTAIYIAMKPDLNRSHYSAYQSDVLNLADVNTIRFGKTRANDNGKITAIKFFSKDLSNSTVWEIAPSKHSSSTPSNDSLIKPPKDTLTLNRIQYWWGDYDTANVKQNLGTGNRLDEFLESEINMNEALRSNVSFISTNIDKIKHKNVVMPMPREGGLKFKATKKYKRMKATFESTSEIRKTFWNKQIRSSPLPLMVKE